MSSENLAPSDSPPSSSSLRASKAALINQVAATAQSFIATRRPWKQLIEFHAFKRPSSFRDALFRIKSNALYFRVNYAIIVVAFVLLSLLWEPYSLMVFMVLFVAWFYLYLFREEPLEICGHVLDERVTLMVLFTFTVVVLLLTSVWLNLLGSILLAGIIVVIHGAFRSTDDIYVEEPGIGVEGLISTVGSLAATGYSRV